MRAKELLQLVLALVVCTVLLGMPATPVYAQQPPPSGGTPSDGGGGGGARGGEIVEAIRKIATVVIDIMIGVAVILMAVGIATGFVGGQFLVTVGQPYGLSSAWIKVVSVVILGLGALLTIVIVNTIIDAIAGLVPPTVIPTI